MMKTMTLSIPDRLKEEMVKVDWVNWSSVARKAFIETLEDVRELEAKKAALKISEIMEDDNREVNEELAKDVVRSVKKTIKSGKKPMSAKKFKEWSESL